MTIEHDARVAPCGPAWRMQMLDTCFSMGFTQREAIKCVGAISKCIHNFHKSPVGIPYYSSIGQADAETLQALAEEVMLDSLIHWNAFVNLLRTTLDL